MTVTVSGLIISTVWHVGHAEGAGPAEAHLHEAFRASWTNLSEGRKKPPIACPVPWVYHGIRDRHRLREGLNDLFSNLCITLGHNCAILRPSNMASQKGTLLSRTVFIDHLSARILYSFKGQAGVSSGRCHNIISVDHISFPKRGLVAYTSKLGTEETHLHSSLDINFPSC